MCGIAGYARPKGEVDVADDVLQRMAETLRRRGPDEEGLYRDRHAGLAIRRLAVMDPEHGHQPVTDERGRYQVVYNGEIYNFAALRQELEAKGHVFASQSDTEVIPHAWEEYGPDCVRHFNGMFAFALWDREARRLFLARDPIGIKPLHWAQVGDMLLFGSELKAILAYPGVSRALDLEALDQYLTYEYVPAPRTMFRAIRKLLPGHWLQFDGGEVRIEAWWEVPECGTEALDERTARQELERLLRESVGRQMVADVPVGLFLSGGIDSSTLVALAAGGSRIKTFSIGFADRSFDESAHARKVAEFFGTDHAEEQLQPADLPQLLTDLTEVLDEPMADASIVPTYLLSRLCRRRVTVALSGEGGDELFGGYPTYQAAQLAGLLGALPRPVMAAIGAAVERLPVSTANLSLDFRLKRFFRHLPQESGKRHILWVGAFSPEQKAELLRPQLNGSLWDPVLRASGRARDPVDLAMLLDLQLYLADDLLVKLDRASMAVSLEGRVPFLDLPLVEFARRLPRQAKVHGYTTKYLLKKTVGPWLPPGIADRPKKGFGIPVARWLQGELRGVLHEVLAPSRVESWGVVHAPVVARLIGEHEAGRADHRKLLWTLMMLSLWWQRWKPELYDC
ncbi:MAG: asparagine synthase (glutamine-hydrolyzing) [Candidatus Xenobia bacterium]